MLTTLLKFSIAILLTIATLTINAQVNIASAVGSSSNEQYSELRGDGMMFTQNKGQIIDVDGNLCPDVLFRSSRGGSEIYLRKTGISYVINNEPKVIREIKKVIEEKQFIGELTTIEESNMLEQKMLQRAHINVHRIDVDFVNSKADAAIHTSNEVEGVTNYYLAHCPNGITGVKSFNTVTIKNIYPNVDVKYYASAPISASSSTSFRGGDAEGLTTGNDKQSGLKYDLIVQPHANPNQIKLLWKGANELRIENDRLIIKTSLGNMIETIPKVYQKINGKIVDVKCKYKLEKVRGSKLKVRGKLQDITYLVSFEFGTYNLEQRLIIDPWASYYSGNYGELGFSVTTDGSGNVAFCGQARSTNLPTSPGAFQTTAPSGRNAFAVKMTSTGSRMWGTYYGNGGFQGTAGWGIASDATENIFVSIANAPSTLPMGATVGNVVQQATGSGGVLVKFDPLLGTRIWSTFYGGIASYGNDVVTDGSNVYLYGSTSSTTNISTGGTFQTALNGVSDVFVAKFASNGSLIWGTYVGGSNNETCGGIAYDALTSSVYIGGYTNSNDFPTTIHQLGYGGNTYDAFIFKLNSAGAQVWSTYYGGSGADYGNVIATDGLGNVIIGGITGSINNIASVGAYQSINGGGTGGYGTNDSFIAKFNNAGVRQWGTYFGGNRWELINGLDVDVSNRIYISGEFEDSDAGDYPISACAYQPIMGGIEDAFIARYEPDGKQTCITYYGGTLHDEAAFDNGYSTGGGSIAIYGNNLHIVGCTEGGFPVTPGAFQTAFGGAEPGFKEFNEAYIAQLCINICESKSIGLGFTTSALNVCNNVPVKFTPTVNNSCDTTGYRFHWKFAGGNPAVSDFVNPTVLFSGEGTHDVQLIVTTICKKDSLTKTNYITTTNCGCNLAGQFTKGTSTCANCGCNEWILVNASNGTPPYTYQWPDGYDKRYKNKICPGNYTVKVTDKNGCSVNVNVSTP